jgi:hypothetical protein
VTDDFFLDHVISRMTFFSSHDFHPNVTKAYIRPHFVRVNRRAVGENRQNFPAEHIFSRHFRDGDCRHSGAL